MRTTLALDDDLHELVTRIAKSKNTSVGAVVSNALRDYFRPASETRIDPPTEGFPFYTFGGDREIAPDVDVKQLLADEDVAAYLELQERLRKQAADATA